MQSSPIGWPIGVGTSLPHAPFAQSKSAIRSKPASHGCPSGKPPASSGMSNEDRKGVSWTTEEHKAFLRGLEMFGKG